MNTKPPSATKAKRIEYEEEIWGRYAAEQPDYERLKKKSGYSKRLDFVKESSLHSKECFEKKQLAKLRKHCMMKSVSIYVS